jgi:peptidoglycan hydrolase CwlO-like protein
MGLFTFNIGVNDAKLDEILSQLKALQDQYMSLQTDFDAKVADLAAEIQNNTSLISSIQVQIEKIFAEVKALVDSQTGVLDLTALDALKASLLANTQALAQAAAANTSIDELNPDVVPPAV